MITSQRVIIYRTNIDQDEFDYEVMNVYDLSSIAEVALIGSCIEEEAVLLIRFAVDILEDENRRASVRLTLHNSPRRSIKLSTKGASQRQHFVYRCDLHERASRLTRDIQRAREIFEEEELTYIQPDDDDDDDDDDIPNEQQTDGLVPMT